MVERSGLYEFIFDDESGFINFPLHCKVCQLPLGQIDHHKNGEERLIIIVKLGMMCPR
jgi:hypothetical protein